MKNIFTLTLSVDYYNSCDKNKITNSIYVWKVSTSKPYFIFIEKYTCIHSTLKLSVYYIIYRFFIISHHYKALTRLRATSRTCPAVCKLILLSKKAGVVQTLVTLNQQSLVVMWSLNLSQASDSPKATWKISIRIVSLFLNAVRNIFWLQKS